MKPRGGSWGDDGWWRPSESFHERQTVTYQSDDPKPVLYDARGNPLTWAKRPLGFQPPGKDRR